MRYEVLLPALALLLPIGDALWFPKATPCVANEVDPWGWTPRITSVPDTLGLQRRQSQLTQTCAYYGVQPLTCAGADFCFYFYSQPYMGCCPVDSSGNFTSCFVDTFCVNQAQSSTECGLQGCSAGTGVCGGPSHYPECVTYALTAGSLTYSSFGCDQSSTYYTLATTPSSASATTTTSPTLSTATSATIPVSPTSSSSTTTSSPSSSSTIPASPTSASTTSTTPTSIPASGPSATSTPNHHVAAIAGGVVGGVVGLALVIGAISFIVYRVKKKKTEAADDYAPEMTGYVQS